MSRQQVEVVQKSEDAYEAIRGINHIVSTPLFAPTLYSVLGNLNNVGFLLAEALDLFGPGLELSLASSDVYEDDKTRTPESSVTEAREAMVKAAEHARALGRLLEKAQSAISGQGYRE